MSKNNRRFNRSQAAHRRLCKKHSRTAETARGQAYDVAFVKSNYHSVVKSRQSRLGRILTRDEKKRAYEDVIFTFY